MKTLCRQNVQTCTLPLLIGIAFIFATARATTGISEPPLVIDGQVFSKSDSSLVTITSANWTMSDGQGNSFH